jgi:hypothetical protein
MADDLIYICEICGTVLDEHHCKAVCPNCGRMFDCSDLPLIKANARIHDGTIELRDGTTAAEIVPDAGTTGTPAAEEPAPPPEKPQEPPTTLRMNEK